MQLIENRKQLIHLGLIITLLALTGLFAYFTLLTSTDILQLIYLHSTTSLLLSILRIFIFFLWAVVCFTGVVLLLFLLPLTKRISKGRR